LLFTGQMALTLKLICFLAAALLPVASGAAGIAAATHAALAANGAVPEASRGAENAWQQTKASQPPMRQHAASANAAKSADAENGQQRGTSIDGAATQAEPPQPLEPPSASWEASFAWGMYHSKMACLAAEHNAGSWALDRKGSWAGVPQKMLQAEELLEEAVEAAPEEHKRGKLAERALRLYYHAKWLAERNHATACEWRYREASRLARQSRRNVLASHALGRLGYFLMHWRQIDEAREVLQESRRVSQKSNPLAPYLLGLLDRQASGSDNSLLMNAEEMIIHAGEQPSADLEIERQKLIQEITYWREAKESVTSCWSTSDAAHLAICLLGHLFFPRG